ncbi:MAG TPA: RluA family pseudouridine synthase, partial [Candidatus Omnitrophota bacterium]|nr:RluA family pseudouridine synthase [Candidatus Omnitrophota bacterium]
MPELREFEAKEQDSGTRVDKWIATMLGEGYSRTQVKSLIEAGAVKLNGRPVKARYALSPGDRIELSIPEAESQDVEPENIPISILYEDEHVVVVNKPAGMVVHPGAGNFKGTLVSALLYHLGTLPGSVAGANRPGIVHRLDKDTSGVMVVAKTEKAMRSLAKQFQKRAVKKTYIALVSGNVEMDNGIIDAPIARQKMDRKKMGVEFSSGRTARTVYHVVERFGDFTLVRIDLFTGRTHQIRVHMKHIGNPVAGDQVYGGKGE